MKFYIVTPSYNALQWLQGCVRSVADQVCEGVQVHHHIQDGASIDGTVEWLQKWQNEHANTEGYQLTFESAPDKGLYDAINIGWKKMPADADITAHLNADEQYLPDVFTIVVKKMQDNPYADMLLTSHIVLDHLNRYICHRRPQFPNKTVSRAISQIITNTCFYRASSFVKRNVYFDITYKSMADLIFFRDILATRPKILRALKLFGSTFVVTGTNVSWSEVTVAERQMICSQLPYILRKLRPFFVKVTGILGVVQDFFYKAPQEYSIYVSDSSTRSLFPILNPTHRWKMRSLGE